MKRQRMTVCGRKITEAYAVDALSWSEMEAIITTAMGSYISGELEITDIKKAQYSEVFFDDADAAADKWYKCKLAFITIDERTQHEKQNTVIYLVQASSLEKARKNVDEVMGGTMVDYIIKKVEGTQIVDVFEHDALKEAVKKF